MLCVLCLLVFSNSFLSLKIHKLVWTNSVIKNIISVMRERSVLVQEKCKSEIVNYDELQNKLHPAGLLVSDSTLFLDESLLCIETTFLQIYTVCRFFVVTPSNSLSNLPQYPPDIQVG